MFGFGCKRRCSGFVNFIVVFWRLAILCSQSVPNIDNPRKEPSIKGTRQTKKLLQNQYQNLRMTALSRTSKHRHSERVVPRARRNESPVPQPGKGVLLKSIVLKPKAVPVSGKDVFDPSGRKANRPQDDRVSGFSQCASPQKINGLRMTGYTLFPKGLLAVSLFALRMTSLCSTSKRRHSEDSVLFVRRIDEGHSKQSPSCALTTSQSARLSRSHFSEM